MRRVERETRATYASPPLHSNKNKETKMSIKLKAKSSQAA